MKSNEEELRRRGYATKEDENLLSERIDLDLIGALHSKEAVIRTIAARKMNPIEKGQANELLIQLQKEKCLYTKIAICETLEKGDASTACLMIPYLGQIGGNQYKELPEVPSKKKSYPLPRDIIARSLGRMEIGALRVLLDAVQRKSTAVEQAKGMDEFTKIRREGIDAIGFYLFYHPEAVDEEIEDVILRILSAYSKDSITVWKMMICLSAFYLERSQKVLQEYAVREDLIGLEARRSLEINRKRNSTT